MPGPCCSRLWICRSERHDPVLEVGLLLLERQGRFDQRGPLVGRVADARALGRELRRDRNPIARRARPRVTCQDGIARIRALIVVTRRRRVARVAVLDGWAASPPAPSVRNRRGRCLVRLAWQRPIGRRPETRSEPGGGHRPRSHCCGRRSPGCRPSPRGRPNPAVDGVAASDRRDRRRGTTARRSQRRDQGRRSRPVAASGREGSNRGHRRRRPHDLEGRVRLRPVPALGQRTGRRRPRADAGSASSPRAPRASRPRTRPRRARARP